MSLVQASKAKALCCDVPQLGSMECPWNNGALWKLSI